MFFSFDKLHTTRSCVKGFLCQICPSCGDVIVQQIPAGIHHTLAGLETQIFGVKVVETDAVHVVGILQTPADAAAALKIFGLYAVLTLIVFQCTVVHGVGGNGSLQDRDFSLGDAGDYAYKIPAYDHSGGDSAVIIVAAVIAAAYIVVGAAEEL